jgi:hypothetical protein
MEKLEATGNKSVTIKSKRGILAKNRRGRNSPSDF